MQRKCLKCSEVNLTASGDLLEACNKCGAIYSRVEEAKASDALRSQGHKRTWQKYAAFAVFFGLLFAWVAYEQTWGDGAKQRQSALKNAASQAARADEERANRLAVSNNPLDGSVHQVERYLKKNAKDPSSLEFMEWSPVAAGANGGFVVRAKFRAKNSLGGYVVEHQVFQLDARGEVISASSL